MDADFIKITESSANFPSLLREIPDVPKILYLRGTLPDASIPCIAIVGTRKATVQGKQTAKTIALELAKRGVVIVSGLAFGIDAAAHEGALAANGTTIAVLGNGIDSIYPSSHESLGMRILASGGAILSEYPAGIPAYPNQFLARNRIVSGLSIATIIIEAPHRSGTLVTAKHALDQGREVFVVPGTANHPNFKGSHELIRSGARLVQNVDEILEDLASSVEFFTSLPATPVYHSKDAAEAAVLKILTDSKTPLSADGILTGTGLASPLVNQTLTFLALEGVINETNGKFSLKQKKA